MLSKKLKLLMSGAFLLTVLLFAGTNFGSRWLHGPDIEPAAKNLTPDNLHTEQRQQSVRASVSQFTTRELETNLVSEAEDSCIDEIFPTNTDESVDEVLVAPMDRLSALVQEGGATATVKSGFPDVPDGFPLTPVWMEDYFNYHDFSKHETLYRVLIELWNQGDHAIMNGAFITEFGRVYPIYPNVIYVTWDYYVCESPDGQSIEVPYISDRLGASSTVNPLLDSNGKLFTEQEILSGNYKTKFPAIRFVDFKDAGYDPASILK